MSDSLKRERGYWIASMNCRRKAGVDGKRHGRVCRVSSPACQSQPAQSGAAGASPAAWRGWRRRPRRKRRALARGRAPLEEEDWEKEIKASSPTEDWDRDSYDSAYDPEDVICSGMLRTSLNPRSIGHAHYSPAVHHVSPVKWVQHAPHTVVDQFIDAEE
ncbi:hypothetical protein COCON_G00025340 [Conger conger]|uniref:Uncharacterized protein n=1 Tax=Conger conger TaxID=82655 RepID=A0A9Q1DXP3_CONCO|nr:hypothetical protein COCON_G00025340 [Conger conger]